jgi:protein SCO1/2
MTRVMGQLALAFGLAACALGGFACREEPPELGHFGKLPAFRLQNQLGNAFSDRDLRGRVVVVDFIFTSCPDVCPLLTEQLRGLRKQLPTQQPLSFVSFSVDPEHDTPARLREFAKVHGVDVPDFWFLTGPSAQVKDVVTRGFKQAMEAQPAREGEARNVLHGTHFVLVDKQGEIRGFFPSAREAEADLKRGLQVLLSEGTDK